MTFSQQLEQIINKLDLTEKQSYSLMTDIMSGTFETAQIAALLTALRSKGESVSELTGFTKAMRKKAISIQAPEGAIDTCGTGGDGKNTFNISTAAALTAAAAGVPVAKHGNRSISSKSGSADVLEALNIRIDLSPKQSETCLEDVGIAFLFAPVYHQSMKYADPARKALGIRTVFNILGPLCNPASVKRQFVGAFNIETGQKMISVLKNIGLVHALNVHSKNGLDEISISHPTTLIELKDDEIRTYILTPEELGIQRVSENAIIGGTAQENAAILRSIAKGKKSPFSDSTIINSAAAIYVAGKAKSLTEGIDIAKETIYSGKLEQKINELRDYTQSMKK